MMLNVSIPWEPILILTLAVLLPPQIQTPVAILPAKGDPMEALKEVLDTRPFGSK